MKKNILKHNWPDQCFNSKLWVLMTTDFENVIDKYLKKHNPGELPGHYGQKVIKAFFGVFYNKALALMKMKYPGTLEKYLKYNNILEPQALIDKQQKNLTKNMDILTGNC